MASSSSSDDDVISAINITPLVDVVLVLLIIFMITAPVIYQSAIKVQLPEATTGEDASSESKLSFVLTKEGSLFWNNEPAAWESLPEKLSAMKASLPADAAAVISADQDTSHGTVIRLVDILRKVGLNRFALNVDRGAKSH